MVSLDANKMRSLAKQQTFDFDFSKRDSAVQEVQEYQADFTTMQIGSMAGDQCRVLRCPACSRNCIAQERAKSWRFIHNALIQSTPQGARWEPVVSCTLDHEQIRTLRDLGVITCHRMGQILEVK